MTEKELNFSELYNFLDERYTVRGALDIVQTPEGVKVTLKNEVFSSEAGPSASQDLDYFMSYLPLIFQDISVKRGTGEHAYFVTLEENLESGPTGI